MKKTLLIFLRLVLLTAPLGTMAAPIVQVAPCSNDSVLTCTTGIDGLEVMGMTFDVSFVGGTFDAVFAVGSPFFFGNEAGAQEAATAISDLLDGLAFGVFVNSPDGIDEIFIPFAEYSPDRIWAVTSFNDDFPSGTSEWDVDPSSIPLRTLEFGEATCVGGGDCLWYAGFNKKDAQVPEPGTLALLGLGLAGMGLRRRKKV